MAIVTGQLKNPRKVHHDKGPRGPWDSVHCDVVWENGSQTVQLGRNHEGWFDKIGKGDEATKWYNVTYSGAYNKTDDIQPAKMEDITKSGDTYPTLARESVTSAAMIGERLATITAQLHADKFPGLVETENYIKRALVEYADVAAAWMQGHLK
jgi:hypothetical protein